jgi:hypothetical protein
MRRILLLLLVLTLTAVQAQRQRSMIMRSPNGEKFKLFINNRLINPRAQKYVKIENLSDNYYQVKLKLRNTGRTLRGQLYVPPFSEITYSFVISHQPGQKSGFIIDEINPLELNEVYEEDIIYENPPYPHGGCIEEIYMPQPVSTARFQNMLEVIKEQSFDNKRMNIAKMIMDMNFFTTNQIIEILNLLTFDNNKLEMAKYAYPHVIDRENYFLVSRKLIFDSHRKELNTYILQYQP